MAWIDLGEFFHTSPRKQEDPKPEYGEEELPRPDGLIRLLQMPRERQFQKVFAAGLSRFKTQLNLKVDDNKLFLGLTRPIDQQETTAGSPPAATANFDAFYRGGA